VEGDLPVDIDPKLAWAQNHPEPFPVEINRASKEELLKVPGIGPQFAQRIVQHRIKNSFYSREELKGLGIKVKRAVPFILISGKSPEPLQLELW